MSRIGALVAFLLVGLLAGIVGASAAENARSALFRVSLTATMTKEWSYVQTKQEGGCTTRTSVEGRQALTLRSRRPSLVRVEFLGDRVRYRPAVVRYLTAQATRSGAVTTRETGSEGCRRVLHADCARARRTLANQAVRFFRNRREEIAFARTPSFGAGSSNCPPEISDVRDAEPELRHAEGEISERGFRNRSVRTLRASGSSEETTEFEGEEAGKVLGRVNWTLTFVRVR